MKPGPLFWKLFLGTTLLIVAVLVTCAWLIVSRVDRFHAEELTSYLTTEARTIRHLLRGKLGPAHAAELDRLATELGSIEGGEIRLTIILPDGTVLADSEATPAEMESHASRKEVKQALADGWGEDTRYSRTVRREMKYVAVRVGPPDDPGGVVRVSMALRTIGQRTDAIQKIIWTITLLGLLAAILFALGLAKVWSNPIRHITQIARSLSRGDLSARAEDTGADEVAMLARSLNEMRDHLAGQLQTIDRQRRTLESLLTQLQEGVLVADPEAKIFLINPAARRMLGLSDNGEAAPGTRVGADVRACVTQPELRGLLLPGEDESALTPLSHLDETHANHDVRTARIQVEGEHGETSLLARASDIVLPGFEEPRSTDGPRSGGFAGRMLVLTEVTELTRAVRVKTDFASNASHELRTPLSAIRAAIETLMSMDLAEDRESAGHFLSVIDRHSSRMEEMVSDLLNLSKIESTPSRFKPQPLNLPALLEDLHARHLERIESKELHWRSTIEPGLRVMEASPYLLRIVLDNLVDNAIKFTDAGGNVEITCQRVAAENNGADVVSIAVTDDGCGIAEHERDRVFERFYQVEKARSGADRGTGLGLSIVRHAVAALNGSVLLDSRLGEGTRVTIKIPQPK